MKTKRRLRTREELLALEEQYPCVLGNLLSLGAAHFRQTNRKNDRRAHRNGASHSLRRKTVAALFFKVARLRREPSLRATAAPSWLPSRAGTSVVAGNWEWQMPGVPKQAVSFNNGCYLPSNS